jgi:hypothetical protein
MMYVEEDIMRSCLMFLTLLILKYHLDKHPRFCFFNYFITTNLDPKKIQGTTISLRKPQVMVEVIYVIIRNKNRIMLEAKRDANPQNKKTL